MATVTDRLGLANFGDTPAEIGNYLLYPRRVILEVIKAAFSNPNLFTPRSAEGIDTDANPFLYVEDEDGTLSPKSRLVVTDYGSEHTVRGEGRPRIVLARGGGKFLSQGYMSRTTPYARATGVFPYLDMFESAIQIRCVARNKIESELLALSVGSMITFFSKHIKEKTELHHIGSVNISDTQPEKSDSEVEQSVTVVTVDVAQSISWLVSKMNPTVLADICTTIIQI